MANVGVEFNELMITEQLSLNDDHAHHTNDILLRSNGDQVKFNDLNGKIIGLYFASSSCESCQRFTPHLIEAYNDLTPNGDFEIILVSADDEESSFHRHFSGMPWLAVPHSNETARDRLKSLYVAIKTPHLVIFNEKGKVVNSNGYYLIAQHGSMAYPFTQERLKELRDEEEAAKKNLTLRTALVSSTRNFVISNDGKEVSVSELEGKMVGLYFSLSSFRSCRRFTPILVDLYMNLKKRGEIFEIVLISLENDQESFKKDFTNMPWHAIPFGDKTLNKLPIYFELSALPTLVIVGPDGKILNLNVCNYIDEYGIQAYPFSPEKLSEVEDIEKARRESQTLESLLVSDELDFVIGKGGMKVSVSEIVGKTLLFYFSRRQCPPCRAFTPKLAKTYHEIKAEYHDFEVIFVSHDNDEESFEEYYSEMPWLALPYGDKRENLLKRILKVSGIPQLVAIGPTGRTLTTEARELVMFFGTDAYPFDDDRMKVMESRLEVMAKEWPEKVRHKLHAEHELVRSLVGIYTCHGCSESVIGWVFRCDDCGFYLHPECAMKGSASENHENHDQDDGQGDYDGNSQASNEGWICDGEVCYRA